MALRIKDSVDLKELEKYGFIHLDEMPDTYTYHIPSEFGQLKDLHINKYGYMAIELYDHYTGFDIPEIIYDLIKADLVVKVEE